MNAAPVKGVGKAGYLRVLGLLIGLAGLYGCAAVLVAGVVAGAAGGVQYTYNNIAYKTYPHNYDTTYNATMRVLKRMGINVAGEKVTNRGKILVCYTVDLKIEIAFERITDKTTKVKVDAKKGRFFKDKATATEILIQAGKELGEA